MSDTNTSYPATVPECHWWIEDRDIHITRLREDLARMTELCQAWEQIAKTGTPVIVQKWLDEKLGAGKSVV